MRISGNALNVVLSLQTLITTFCKVYEKQKRADFLWSTSFL